MVGKWLSDLIMPEVKCKRIANSGFTDVEATLLLLGRSFLSLRKSLKQKEYRMFAILKQHFSLNVISSYFCQRKLLMHKPEESYSTSRETLSTKCFSNNYVGHNGLQFNLPWARSLAKYCVQPSEGTV